ncbi:cytochrome P450 monooxygenase pc-3 [Lenzites betulinus]|nr:cytochrome P450 monooxygenase pc-3 [Lenzites betulinus]
MLLPKKVPPGFVYTIRQGSIIFSPAVVTLLLSRLLRIVFGVQLHVIPVALIAIVSVPAVVWGRLSLARRRVRLAAKRVGAVLPPSWEGKSFGNFDLLNYALERFANGYLGDGFWERIDELGHLHSLTFLGDVTYLTNDAAVLKSILATDFSDFEKGDVFRDTMNSVLGTGVFNADGDLWKFHRMMTRPYFSRDKISHFELFDRHTDLAIQKIKDRFRGGHAVDFQDVISRFTLDSATEFLFGRCVDSLKSDLPYAHNDQMTPKFNRERNVAERFSSAFAEAQALIAQRSRVGWIWHVEEMLHDKSAEHMEVVDAYLKPILEEVVAKNRVAKAQVKAGDEDEQKDDETLLDHLVKLTDDPVVLHDETLNILIAGRDTTAATLTFAVYLMALYPHVFQRLRAEVLEKVGPTHMPTFDDVRNMKYLRAVINETLRLYPTVPFNVRVATHDTTLPNPSSPSAPRVFVAEGTPIAYSVFFLHRRKDYWGPDAEFFDPDRWLDERLNKYFTANPFIFLPFNAGPRICLGQQFAYNEMSFFLIRLLQNFKNVELDLAAQPPDARPPKEWAIAEGHKGQEKVIAKCHLTLYVHGGLWVKMTEAEHDV